jgi:hypothetical protein
MRLRLRYVRNVAAVAVHIREESMVRFIARTIVVIAVLLGLCCTQVQAWEFRLSSSTTLSYLYFAQMGDNGFFGRYNVDSTPVTPDAAVANGWLGDALGIVSGADAAISSTSSSLFPRFWANQAIFLSGVFRIGNVETGRFPGGGRSFANGEWLGWLVTVEMPWGVASFGKKPFGFGMGLQYDSTVRTEEYLALVSDMGPVQIGFGVYPSRTTTELNPNRTSGGIPFNAYFNTNDTSGHPTRDVFAFVNYASGPLEMGAGILYSDQHIGPEGTLRFDDRQSTPAIGLTGNEGWVYIRYDNQRFFIQAEADWYYRTVRFQRSVLGNFVVPLSAGTILIGENTDGSGSIFRPQYTESWRYSIEAGFLSGPFRVAFLYAFVPGPDRRHGVLIDKQAVIMNPFLPNFEAIIYHPDHGNSTLFRSYSSIFVDDYGSGVGALNRSGEGYLVDASVLAARCDYAIAANLNVYASFFHAVRVSHGYGWGAIRPVLVPNAGFAAVLRPVRNFTAPSPSIPDNALGWEVGVGLDWKLFQSLSMSLTAAYWEPGAWFKFACVDRSVLGWNDATGTRVAPWGVNPDRAIDGIFGLNYSLAINF